MSGARRGSWLDLSSSTVALANVALVGVATFMIFFSSVVTGFDEAAYDAALVVVAVLAVLTGLTLQVARRWTYASALTAIDVGVVVVGGAVAAWASSAGPDRWLSSPLDDGISQGHSATQAQAYTQLVVGPVTSGRGHAWFNLAHSWVPWVVYVILVAFLVMIGTLLRDLALMVRRRPTSAG
jgi:hypothetical protein